ncbi:hypothetical protein ACFFNX_18390 [Actinoallomurus acaciae]|uniref:YD repeat-containing protein n=1 Tax=Actinoallomurus acaciae TaxID=502577 RepID=A0ABV5YGH9_9ACTN
MSFVSAVAPAPPTAGGQGGPERESDRPPVAQVDPLGHTTRSEWDRHDRLLSRTDPLGRTTRYDRDEAGNRDVFGRTAAVTDPAWRTMPSGATEHWRYDAEGNLVEHVDAAGQISSRTDNAAHTVRCRRDVDLRPVRAPRSPPPRRWGFHGTGFSSLTTLNGSAGAADADGGKVPCRRSRGVAEVTTISSTTAGSITTRRSTTRRSS